MVSESLTLGDSETWRALLLELRWREVSGPSHLAPPKGPVESSFGSGLPGSRGLCEADPRG